MIPKKKKKIVLKRTRKREQKYIEDVLFAARKTLRSKVRSLRSLSSHAEKRRESIEPSAGRERRRGKKGSCKILVTMAAPEAPVNYVGVARKSAAFRLMKQMVYIIWNFSLCSAHLW